MSDKNKIKEFLAAGPSAHYVRDCNDCQISLHMSYVRTALEPYKSSTVSACTLFPTGGRICEKVNTSDVEKLIDFDTIVDHLNLLDGNESVATIFTLPK
jgi:hypothetical protein